MRIDDLEAALETGTFEPVFVEYRDGWELKLRHSSAEEQSQELGRGAGRDGGNDAYWLDHVIGWRGLTRRGEEVPFDRQLLRKFWRLDGEFRLFILRSCQSVDTFRGQSRTAAAAGSREGQ